VRIQDMNADLAEAMGIDASGGALIAQVLPKSPAARAGLEAGDVIVAMNGEPIRNATDLRNRIGMSEIGKSVLLNVRRKNEKLAVTVTLAARSEARVQARDIDARLNGAVFGAIEEQSPLYGQVEGVQVLEVQPGSPAARTGLRKGDVITSVNRQPVPDVATLERVASAGQRHAVHRHSVARRRPCESTAENSRAPARHPEARCAKVPAAESNNFAWRAFSHGNSHADRYAAFSGKSIARLRNREMNEEMRIFLVACHQASVSVETMSRYLGLDAGTIRSELVLGIEAWNVAQRRTNEAAFIPHLGIPAVRN